MLGAATLLAFASGADRAWFGLTDKGWLPWGDDGSMVTVAAGRVALLPQGWYAALTQPIRIGGPYPPLVALVGGVVAKATGTGLQGLLASQALWAWIGAGAALVAGKRIGGPWGALLGAALWIWTTQQASLADQFFAEPAVGALGLLTVVLLARSAGMRGPGSAAAAGVSAGLGLLAKFTFGAFIGPIAGLWAAGSAAAAVGRGRGPGWLRFLAGSSVFFGALASFGLLAVWARTGKGWMDLQIAVGATIFVLLVMLRPREWRVGLSLLLFVGLAGGVAGAWYLPNRGLLREFLDANVDRQYAGDPLPWPLAMAYYARVVLRDTLDTPMLLLVALGAVRSFWKPIPIGVLCLLAASGGVVLLAAAPYQSERYVAPAVSLLVPVAIAAVPEVLLPLAAIIAALASTLLLTTRHPEVNQWVVRQSGIAKDDLRLGQERQAISASRTKVEALVAAPWRPFPLQVRLPTVDAEAPPLVSAVRAAAALCPPDAPVHLSWTRNEVGMPVTSISSWEPHPPWTLGALPAEGEISVIIELAPGEASIFEGQYIVRLEHPDPRCPQDP